MQILWNRESYSWPGNIRVLQNIVEKAVVLCNGETFWVEKSWVSSQPASPSSQAVSTAQPSLPLTEILLSQEKEIIESALAAGKGKIARPNGAAAKLGISPVDPRFKKSNSSKLAGTGLFPALTFCLPKIRQFPRFRQPTSRQVTRLQQVAKGGLLAIVFPCDAVQSG
jgi:hypothetical protein